MTRSMWTSKSVFSSKRRSRMEMVLDVLCSADKRMIFTKIMYDANVNSIELHTILDLLIMKGLVMKSKKVYSTTQQGRNFVNWYRKILMLWNGLGKDNHSQTMRR